MTSTFVYPVTDDRVAITDFPEDVGIPKEMFKELTGSDSIRFRRQLEGSIRQTSPGWFHLSVVTNAVPDIVIIGTDSYISKYRDEV